MIRPRVLARALVPVALHALAREIDAGLGVALHTTLDVPRLATVPLELLGREELERVALVTLAGCLAWLALAAFERRGRTLARTLEDTSSAFAPFLLRPALTLLALASVAFRPTYPYAFTLPVALTQDLGCLQNAAAFAAFLAGRSWPAWRVRWPRPAELGTLFFAVFLFLIPASMRLYDGHTGNEPKTLRMAVSLGLWGTLDVEDTDGPMEGLHPRSVTENASTMARTAWREAAALATEAWRDPEGLGKSAIRATHLARQTVTGKDGGAFHILAPGPSLLLAPTLRADRAINRAWGRLGPIVVSLLVWFAFSAALLGLLAATIERLTGDRRVAAVVTSLFALTPPFLFFFYQFYPETLAALSLLWLAGRMHLDRRIDDRSLWPLALVLAFLPWLHQKYVPVWGVLVVMAFGKAVNDLVDLRRAAQLLAPQALSLAAYAIYNFAITGSPRLDALFLAWGPSGVSSERLGQGLLGLLLDARYGILPYAPIFVLGLAGAILLWRARSPFCIALVPAAVYYLTVASANNWAGSICNLGRFLLPIAPWAVVAAGFAARKALDDRRRAAVCLVLAFWAMLGARALWSDPQAANDSALLIAKSAFADGNVYIPNLWLRSWSEAAPGLWVRVVAWVGVVGGLAWWLASAQPGRQHRPLASVFRLVALLLLLGFALEAWSMGRREARFEGQVRVGRGVDAFLGGNTAIRGARIIARSGSTTLLVRSYRSLERIDVRAFGSGRATFRGGVVALTPRGIYLPVALDPVVKLRGRGGVDEWLYRARFEIASDGEVGLELADAS